MKVLKPYLAHFGNCVEVVHDVMVTPSFAGMSEFFNPPMDIRKHIANNAKLPKLHIAQDHYTTVM